MTVKTIAHEDLEAITGGGLIRSGYWYGRRPPYMPFPITYMSGPRAMLGWLVGRAHGYLEAYVGGR